MTGPQAVRVVGGLVPPALFTRIQAGEVTEKASLSAGSYHLAGRETIRDAANRAWSYLHGRWADWRESDRERPGDTAGTGSARAEWLTKLFEQLGYGQLQPTHGGLRVDEAEFAVSHIWQHVPVHLLGPGVDLDRRNPGVAGAARAPQAMLQELLNRTDEHLWAFLSNGLTLRLLRDSTSLAGSAYVEFDLETIFDGELFGEFLLLWQLCHVSRVQKRGGLDAAATDCWLETWREEVRVAGTRALKELRVGVERALAELGTGFLEHPDNDWLRDALRDGRLGDHDLHRALLRLVYRLLFLSVAEARDVLHPPRTPAQARQRYTDYYSLERLRRLARVRGGGPHADLWESVRVVLRALGGNGLSALGLPALAGLFDPADTPLNAHSAHVDLLADAAISNANLLAAMRSLGWVRFRGERVQPVDYRNLDAEELGSIYELLLELVPKVDLDQREFTVLSVHGSDRKETGSYYTPTSLVNALLDSALDPLLTDARKNAADAAEWERNLLALTVCDPACGSGHFLVAAARRIARELAEARSGEDEPAPADVQHALRDVIGNCIYGVDVTSMAAELAKVSLWMEAIEPGKPLGFLDSRIRVGNSLLGATPALIANGLPDKAFDPLEGDDKSLVRELKKRNTVERDGQLGIDEQSPIASNVELAEHRDPLVRLRDDADAVRDQAKRWEEYEAADTQLTAQRIQADAWCAAFVWKLIRNTPGPPTTATIRALLSNPAGISADQRAEITRLAKAYRFFHWHLEFPEIFQVPEAGEETGPEGWTGGFSCLLGNPPWERVKLQEQEFFAARDPEIAQAPNKAVRTKLIQALLNGGSPSGAALHQAYLEAKRQAEGESTLLRRSGRYPLTGRGDVNTYAVFAETFRTLTGPLGRSGVIVPTGIATDDTTQYFFRDLVEGRSLATLFDFENNSKDGRFFDHVDSRKKFSLLTISGRFAYESSAEFAFFLRDPAVIENYSFSMTPEEILLLNPNTGTCPVFRSRRDAEITLGIYKRAPILVKEGDPNGNPWGISFTRMFDMSNDAHLFRTREDLEAAGWTSNGNRFARGDELMLPLYQGMMATFFDHRAADVKKSKTAKKRQNQPSYLSDDDKESCSRLAFPMYWVDSTRLREFDLLPSIGFSSIVSSTNERTFEPFPLPNSCAGNSAQLIRWDHAHSGGALLACVSSYVFDYVARIKAGGTNMNLFIVKQIPLLAPSQLDHPAPWNEDISSRAWLDRLVTELIYTAIDMAGFAKELGDTGVPFRWNSKRRVLLRAELDGSLFHLYEVDRGDAEYMLDGFPNVRKADIAAHGEYRTKRLILEVYDRMAEAIRTGEPYQTIVDPPPGQGPRHPAQQKH